MPDESTISQPRAAIVLCGGRSSRMGSPKYLLEFGGEILLQRMCRIVSEVVTLVVVVAAPDQEIPELCGLSDGAVVEVVRDEFPGAGPLAGICTGLKRICSSLGSDCAVFATSCDAPLLTPEVVRFLFEQLGTARATAVTEQDFVHPLCAVYRAEQCDQARVLLTSGERRPRALLQAVGFVPLPAHQLRTIDPRLDCLRNLNTPEDYQAATREL